MGTNSSTTVTAVISIELYAEAEDVLIPNWLIGLFYPINFVSNLLKIWTLEFMQKAELHQAQETAVWTLCSKCRLFFQRDLTLTAFDEYDANLWVRLWRHIFPSFLFCCSFPIHHTASPCPPEPHTLSKPEIGISDDLWWCLRYGCWHIRVGFELFAKSCQSQTFHWFKPIFHSTTPNWAPQQSALKRCWLRGINFKERPPTSQHYSHENRCGYLSKRRNMYSQG